MLTFKYSVLTQEHSSIMEASLSSDPGTSQGTQEQYSMITEFTKIAPIKYLTELTLMTPIKYIQVSFASLSSVYGRYWDILNKAILVNIHQQDF